MHVTDDVLLFSRAAINQLETNSIETTPAETIDGQIIANTCRWYEFVVRFVDDSSPRATFKCKTLKQGKRRDFWGFNRGKNAILEAAILATRVKFLPAAEIQEQYRRLESIVQKTGGKNEHRALELLTAFVESMSTV